MSLLEAVFARGDRRLCAVLYSAWQKGCTFDAWDDSFDFSKWTAAFKDCGIDPDFYTARKRAFDEVLPWDHLDYGISKKFLIKENELAHKESTSPHCREKCSACGANALNGGKCDAINKA
ncbi:MAG: hypothetical protein GX264_04110 [Clostridiales bacterium]|nr:hypothetical protein [Clostridiales bacterium]